MADTERMYILKTVDDQEYGPVDQATLVRWAESGRITGYCQIRSTLLPRWERACDVPFLREILLEQLEEEQKRKRSLWQKIKARATMKAVEASSFGGLHHIRPQDFDPAGPITRFLAGLFDFFMLMGILVAIYLIFALLCYLHLLSPNIAFYVGFVVSWLSVLFYFVTGIASRGQTPGQRFWGIILIHHKGTQFYLGRAFAYTILLFLFGLLTLSLIHI